MMMAAAPRKLTLCADDYGISEGVNRAIRDLIAQGRLNATSVMVVTPAFTRDEIAALKTLRQRVVSEDGRRCALGLHVTLTAPFRPLTLHFRPLSGEQFLSLNATLARAMLRRFDVEIVRAEILAQLTAFIEAFGTPPDFVDGHQHVQIFPVLRDAFIDAVKEKAPDAWVRQCGAPQGAAPVGLKARLLDHLSKGFRAKAAKAGLTFNPAFSGAYDFTRAPDFASLFPGFLQGLPDGALIMCHPGFVDDTLRSLDPFTDQREREHAYFASDAFADLLTAENTTLL